MDAHQEHEEARQPTGRRDRMKNPWKERKRKQIEKEESFKKWAETEKKFIEAQRKSNEFIMELKQKKAQREYDVQQSILDMLPLIKDIHFIVCGVKE
jgi:uncharacterized membrane protein YkoI